MLLVAVGAVWLLLGLRVDGAKLDVIRTGDALDVGLGGFLALWLAVRKQRSTTGVPLVTGSVRVGMIDRYDRWFKIGMAVRGGRRRLPGGGADGGVAAVAADAGW
ncbi:hypothetical protein [Actinokineospora cianjurensis]|nr:hypothetical protein [Actinokineospora cianjurensis]